MSGSIFRRGGQKAEAHGSPSEQQISNTQLETKLAALQQGWSAPLTACVLAHSFQAFMRGGAMRSTAFRLLCRSTQSLAVWRPEHGGAEVAIERGNVLQRMGESANTAFTTFAPLKRTQTGYPVQLSHLTQKSIATAHLAIRVSAWLQGIDTVGSFTYMWKKLCKTNFYLEFCCYVCSRSVADIVMSLPGIW